MNKLERCKSVIRLMLVRHDDLDRLKPYYSEYMIKKALKGGNKGERMKDKNIIKKLKGLKKGEVLIIDEAEQIGMSSYSKDIFKNNEKT